MGGQVEKLFDYLYRHHRIFLNFRAQDRIVHSESFSEAWKLADEQDKIFLLTMLRKPDPVKMKKLILRILVGGLDQYTIMVLREMARYNNVLNYSRMSKVQLIQHLTLKGVTDGSTDVNGVFVGTIK